MPKILITDACKPSLVMSSEVFKDKIAGALIFVATSGKQTLEMLAAEKVDMCVVDFDLPDTDGITLIHAMRRTFQGPILLTAYPDSIVEQAVKSDLFAWGDAGAWIQKPVKFDVLSAKIDQFLLDKHRLGRRFPLGVETLVIGKGAGRGKRAPKATGRIINISLGGACIELDSPLKMIGGDEMFVALDLPPTLTKERRGAVSEQQGAPVLPARTAGKAPNKRQQDQAAKKRLEILAAEAKIRCTVAWVDKRQTTVGFQFNRLTDVQRKGLEELLRETTVPASPDGPA